MLHLCHGEEEEEGGGGGTDGTQGRARGRGGGFFFPRKRLRSERRSCLPSPVQSAQRRRVGLGGGPYGPNPTTLCEIDRILLRNRGPSNCKLNHAHLSVIL